MKVRLIIISFLLLGLMACKEKESPLLVTAGIEGLSWEVEAADGDTPYRVKVSARSTTAAVRHITIATYDPVYGDKMVKDTVLTDPVKSMDLYVNYRTPIFEETTTIHFAIQAYATDGEQASTKMLLTVLPTDQKLPSTDNVTLYSDLSGKASCFALDSRTTFLKQDSTTVQGYYFRDIAPADSTDKIGATWHSKDIQFARSESFNFAEATESMVENAYRTCQPTYTIQNLKYDDVLLFGTSDKALGVLKIMQVYDEAGKENDRYIFSIKCIKKQ